MWKTKLCQVKHLPVPVRQTGRAALPGSNRSRDNLVELIRPMNSLQYGLTTQGNSSGNRFPMPHKTPARLACAQRASRRAEHKNIGMESAHL